MKIILFVVVFKATLACAADKSLPIAGRILKIEGTVQWRNALNESERKLDVQSDLGRILHTRESLKLDEGSQIELQLGSENSMRLIGPTQWYPLLWEQIHWEDAKTSDLSARLRQRAILGGKNRGSKGEAPPDIAQVLQVLSPYLNLTLPVDASGIRDASLLSAVVANFPLCAQVLADAGAARLSREQGVTISQKGDGLVIKRQGVTIASLEGDSQGRQVGEVLTREAIWQSFRWLKNRSHSTVEIQLLLQPKANPCYRAGDNVTIQAINKGHSGCRGTLVNIEGDGQVTLEANFELKPGETRPFQVPASKSMSSVPDLLILIGSVRPLGQQPIRPDEWNAACEEICVK